jgi:hypothetical protein
MYDCEISSLTAREEQLGCQNIGSRRMFGSKRGKITRCWRRLQKQEVHEIVL